jgi:hypothetical protein
MVTEDLPILGEATAAGCDRRRAPRNETLQTTAIVKDRSRFADEYEMAARLGGM